MRRVTLGTLVVGAVLAAAPLTVSRWLRVEAHSGAVRRAGVADLALVPGLAWGRPRWMWAVVRTLQTLGFAGVATRWARKDPTPSSWLLVVLLVVLASQDAIVARQLWGEVSTRGS